MKIVIIDGQGGKLGQTLAEAIIKSKIPCELFAIGTNSIATSTILKGGAMYGATGENPVIVACRDADVIIGPVGILSADSMGRGQLLAEPSGNCAGIGDQVPAAQAGLVEELKEILYLQVGIRPAVFQDVRRCHIH